ATVDRALGHHPQAADRHQCALAVARDAGDRYPQVQALIGLAAAHRHLGEYEQAVITEQTALAIAREADFGLLVGQASTGLVSTYLDMGRVEDAIVHAGQALATHHKTGHRLGQAQTHLLLGNALRRRGEPIEASRGHWHDALALYTDIGTPEAAS